MVRRGKGATAVVASTLVVAALTATGGPSQAASRHTSAVPAAVTTQPRPIAAHAALGRPELPLGGTTIFPRYQLVAYYGTAHTGCARRAGGGHDPADDAAAP